MAIAAANQLAGSAWTNSFGFGTVENILFNLSAPPTFSPDGLSLTFTYGDDSLTFQSEDGLSLSTYVGTIRGISSPNMAISGLDVPFLSFAQAVGDGDIPALNTLVWGGHDTITGAASNDTIRGYGGNDALYGNSGTDRLFGDEGADSLFGGNGKDVLYGGVGRDLLNGGAGDDRLIGGSGNDQIIGGTGIDNVYGGLGADTFAFSALSDFGLELGLRPRFDIIRDFYSAQGDRIDFNSIDADTGLRGNQVFSFIGDATFAANTPGTVRVTAVDRPNVFLIELNTDNDVQAEAVLLVVSPFVTGFPGGRTPVAADFIL